MTDREIMIEALRAHVRSIDTDASTKRQARGIMEDLKNGGQVRTEDRHGAIFEGALFAAISGMCAYSSDGGYTHDHIVERSIRLANKTVEEVAKSR
tara:strand:- start:285 stop:572 length:288 start_codon:yes stop_codon:yes gene_type:complete